MSVLDKLSNGFLVRDVIAFLVTMGGGAWILGKALAVNWRLAKNLDRKILVFSPNENKSLEKELRVLGRPGYFQKPKVLHDFNSIDESDIRGAGIVILGYDRNMSNFDEFLDMVSRHDRPLILYTFELGAQMDEGHRAALMGYKWHVVSSTPLRLVSDVFTTLATYQYE